MSETIIKISNGVIRQQKITILKDVSLEIKSGEFIYIIGKVGSGKSSLLKTLYAELPLEYGNAEVAGFQLQKIKKSQIPLLRRKCGIVFQDFRLLTDRNVYANLEFVLKATGWNNKRAILERIDNVLEKVEMSDKKFKMPHELSGGEQQRIVLARALLNAPPLILADEPTGNIDPETSYKLIELLKDICATGKTIIIATHQYDLIQKYPGRVLRCENERLTEDLALSAKPVEEVPEIIEAIENIPVTSDIISGNEEQAEEAPAIENEPEKPEEDFTEEPEESGFVSNEPELPFFDEEVKEIVIEEELPASEEHPATLEIIEEEIKESGSDDRENEDTAPVITETEETITTVKEDTVTGTEDKEENEKETKTKTPSSPFGFELID